MILKQDLKWSPDGMRVEIIRAGEYEDKELPERVREIATAAGIVSDKRNDDGVAYVIHHNDPFQESYEEDILESGDDITGHYRVSE